MTIAVPTTRTDEWYEAQLRTKCEDGITVDAGKTGRASRRIITHATIKGGGSAHLNQALVLDDITIESGATLTGDAWAPPSATVPVRRGIYTLPWKELYQKAVKLNIIESD
jgi:hypothetical protein